MIWFPNKGDQTMWYLLIFVRSIWRNSPNIYFKKVDLQRINNLLITKDFYSL